MLVAIRELKAPIEFAGNNAWSPVLARMNLHESFPNSVMRVRLTATAYMTSTAVRDQHLEAGIRIIEQLTNRVIAATMFSDHERAGSRMGTSDYANVALQGIYQPKGAAATSFGLQLFTRHGTLLHLNQPAHGFEMP